MEEAILRSKLAMDKDILLRADTILVILNKAMGDIPQLVMARWPAKDRLKRVAWAWEPVV